MEDTTPQTPESPLAPEALSQEPSASVPVQITPPAKTPAAPGRWKKIIGFAILAGAFGAVGYFVHPYAASAVSKPQAAVQDDSQAKQFQAQRKQLEEKARDLADRLAGLEESLKKAQQQDQEQGLKLQAAQELVTELDEQLALADSSDEPLKQELAAAQAVANQTTAKLTEAGRSVAGPWATGPTAEATERPGKRQPDRQHGPAQPGPATHPVARVSRRPGIRLTGRQARRRGPGRTSPHPVGAGLFRRPAEHDYDQGQQHGNALGCGPPGRPGRSRGGEHRRQTRQPQGPLRPAGSATDRLGRRLSLRPQ